MELEINYLYIVYFFMLKQMLTFLRYVNLLKNAISLLERTI